jgi:hypothetical protein
MFHTPAHKNLINPPAQRINPPATPDNPVAKWYVYQNPFSGRRQLELAIANFPFVETLPGFAEWYEGN